MESIRLRRCRAEITQQSFPRFNISLPEYGAPDASIARRHSLICLTLVSRTKIALPTVQRQRRALNGAHVPSP